MFCEVQTKDNILLETAANESKIRKTKAVKKLCTKEKVIIRLNFNPGLALTGFLPTLRCLQQVNPDMSPRSDRKKQHLGSGQL